METKQLKRLPVGIQTFEKIRENDMLYIDKTEYIWNMIHLGNYVFLSRPRRFGKSLLVSTLQAYFEGRKDLFKGLYIDEVEKEWTACPVLHFDMSTAKHCNKEDLLLELSNKLTRYEAIYGICPAGCAHSPTVSCTANTVRHDLHASGNIGVSSARPPIFLPLCDCFSLLIV